MTLQRHYKIIVYHLKALSLTKCIITAPYPPKQQNQKYVTGTEKFRLE